jgi:hypothetical protein
MNLQGKQAYFVAFFVATLKEKWVCRKEKEREAAALFPGVF